MLLNCTDHYKVHHFPISMYILFVFKCLICKHDHLLVVPFPLKQQCLVLVGVLSSASLGYALKLLMLIGISIQISFIVAEYFWGRSKQQRVFSCFSIIVLSIIVHQKPYIYMLKKKKKKKPTASILSEAPFMKSIFVGG